MRRTLLVSFVTVAGAALLSAGCSGRSGPGGHEGSLGPGDQILPSDNSYYDAYPIDVQAGETYVFTLESDDFDAYLLLTDGGLNIIAQNDDFDGLNSQLTYTFQTAGRYEVLANSYEGGETGDYVLYIERQGGGAVNVAPPTAAGEGEPPRGTPPDGERIELDDSGSATINGSLGAGDLVLAEDNSFYDRYLLDVQANETFTITLESAQFDPYLLLTSGGFNVLTQNDDANGLNSQIVYTFPNAGRYEIIANSYSGGETGAYTLRIQRQQSGVAAGAFGGMVGMDPGVPDLGGLPAPDFAVPGIPQPPFGEPGIGAAGNVRSYRREQGALDANDPVLANDVAGGGQYYDVYPLQARAGDLCTITLTADFDAYLLLRDAAGNVLAQNDDGPGIGLNSQITYTAGENADLEVVATSLHAGQVGNYSLEIECREIGAVAAAGGAIEPGQSVAGDMSQSFGQIEGRPYVPYELDARAGETYMVRMQANFDTYLIVHDSAGVEVGRNDDFDGLNSGLQFTATQTGPYRILATSYGSVAAGQFNVSVQRIGEPAPQPEPPAPPDAGRPEASDLDEPVVSPEAVIAEFLMLLERGDTDGLAALMAADASGAARRLHVGEIDADELERIQAEFAGAQLLNVRALSTRQWLATLRAAAGSPQRLYLVEEDGELRIERIGRR